MRMKLISAAAMSLWMGTVYAVNDEDHPYAYAGGAYLYELSDSSRESANGDGFQLHVGWPLAEYGYDNWAAELTFHSLGRKRDIDRKKDYQSGLMFDLVYDFGLFGWGNDATVGPRFKPFVLAGLGVVEDDVRGDDHQHFGVNLGAGALVPLNFHGLAARVEARLLSQSNDKSVASEDVLLDYRLSIGLQVPLSPLFRKSEPEVAPAAECGLAVVDPITGRSDCGIDSDRDGVLDGLDQCPGTPVGTSVDARGCPLDAMPVTTAGDNDGDGVADNIDRCPGTPAGARVDAAGCVIAQTLVLRGVQFENDAAVLTPESRAILNEVAASLRNQPGVRVEIGGHTDSIGNDSYNHMLSQQRAEAVRQYLIARDVSGDRLVAMGYGEFRPLASNETPAGRAQNRRVEFKLIVD